ncbi:MAG: PilW family protein [Spirochaetales bacterium]|jgi:type IV pilus assembly protein PilW|nr:PilW family protein [Spirochaetales bacterium]
MNKMSRHTLNSGFSLVELLVTLLLTSLITTGIFSAYRAQSANYVLQEQVVEMQQRVRAGMDMVTMELREAGYDPGVTGNPGITAATATSVTFTLVADDDGETNDGNTIVDEPNEEKTISYNFDDTADSLIRTIGSKSRDLIEDVELIELLYFDEDGGSLTLPLSATGLKSIRSITISILVRAAVSNPKLIQNTTYTLASDTETAAYTDQFRRSLLITTVQCRNLGFNL